MWAWRHFKTHLRKASSCFFSSSNNQSIESKSSEAVLVLNYCPQRVKVNVLYCCCLLSASSTTTATVAQTVFGILCAQCAHWSTLSPSVARWLPTIHVLLLSPSYQQVGHQNRQHYCQFIWFPVTWCQWVCLSVCDVVFTVRWNRANSKQRQDHQGKVQCRRSSICFLFGVH